jgi:hypothetical protein
MARDAGSHPVPDLRSYLLGTWRVRRGLLNRSDGTRGTFTGRAVFTPLPDDAASLRWREDGTVSWGVSPPARHGGSPSGGQPAFTGPASREYLLVPGGAGGLWEVRFEDGRSFHALSLAQGSWAADHWCSPDTYRVRFTVHSEDRLDYEWDVTGPVKDQLLTTELTRAAAAH